MLCFEVESQEMGCTRHARPLSSLTGLSPSSFGYCNLAARMILLKQNSDGV